MSQWPPSGSSQSAGPRQCYWEHRLGSDCVCVGGEGVYICIKFVLVCVGVCVGGGGGGGGVAGRGDVIIL